MKKRRCLHCYWYEYKGCAIYPFTRSRRSRKNPDKDEAVVTVRLWGVCAAPHGIPTSLINVIDGRLLAPSSCIDVFDTREKARISLDHRYAYSLAGRDETCAPLYEKTY